MPADNQPEAKQPAKPRYRFTPEDARKSAETRKRKAARGRVGSDQPSETEAEDEVIAGLLKAAKGGSAPAARELRSWLAARQPRASDADLDLIPIEDMTPDQLVLAESVLLKHIARVLRRVEESRKRDAGLHAIAREGEGAGTPPDDEPLSL
jgi:hypothetical protein